MRRRGVHLTEEHTLVRIARRDSVEAKPLIIAGASNPGSIKLVHAINADVPTWELLGFVDDDPQKWSRDFFGYPVLGGLSLLAEPAYKHVYSVCCIYGGSILTRLGVIQRMSEMGARFATLIHPWVSTEQVKIGKDCMINEGCILNYGAEIGDHCILNFGVSVGHETILEDAVFCAPRVTIPGRVRIKRGATLGIGSVVNGDITIGEYAMVAMGAVVLRDVPDRATAIGNPARVVVPDSTQARHPL